MNIYPDLPYLLIYLGVTRCRIFSHNITECLAFHEVQCSEIRTLLKGVKKIQFPFL